MSLLLYFKERRRRPVVTVLDKHARKTNPHQLKLNDYNVRLSFQIMPRVNNYI